EHVPALIVRAENIRVSDHRFRARRQAPVHDVELREVIGILRRDPTREDRQQRDDHENRQAKQREVRPGEFGDETAERRFFARDDNGCAHDLRSSRTRGSSTIYSMSTTKLIVMNNSTIIMRYATITGRSKTLMLSMISLPIPGQANT